MSSNLPPGVTESMIPGNRPEDEAWETFLETVDEKLGDTEPEAWYAILEMGLAAYEAMQNYLSYRESVAHMNALDEREARELSQSED